MNAKKTQSKEDSMSRDEKVWLNGTLISRQAAVVPLLSHGFSRASAIFDVFRVYPGPGGPVAFRADAHIRRLMKTAELLGMKLAYGPGEILQAVKEAIRANDMQSGMVKILAYWGQETLLELVLDSPLDMAVFAIADDKPFDPGAVKPISACLSKWRKIHPETVPVGAKACANYLNGYLVRKDANSRGYDVGLSLGTDGFLAEGSIESVFIVKDNVLKTPPLGRILSSITRMSILEAAPQAGIATREVPITAAEALAADEMFTSYTSIKVSPVARFEDHDLPAPGPVTRQVMELMNAILQFKDERFADWLQPLS
jgi:branched-chain amino acid aminotransferase